VKRDTHCLCIVWAVVPVILESHIPERQRRKKINIKNLVILVFTWIFVLLICQVSDKFVLFTFVFFRLYIYIPRYIYLYFHVNRKLVWNFSRALVFFCTFYILTFGRPLKPFRMLSPPSPRSSPY